MKEIYREYLSGERALYRANDLIIKESIFDDGESPLKHSENICMERCSFKWKYPLWYAKHIKVKDSVWTATARSGIWYGENISIENTMIEAPKQFRRCDGLSLWKVSLPNAEETFWSCRNILLEQVSAKGDYFAKDCENVVVDGIELYGNYCFDGAKNVTIRNAKLLSKDSFWNTENVTVTDSYINGEYLGWNSKNLTLENCTIESLQGFCYVENLVLKNCTLINTSLAFEHSSVHAEINGRVDSIFNPSSGTIKADEVGILIIDETKVDPQKSSIILTDGKVVEALTPDEVEITSDQGSETVVRRKNNG